MQLLSALLALVACCVTWGLLASFSQGFYPLGTPGYVDAVLFLTPFFCLTLWLGLAKVVVGKVSSGLWLFASSPLLGALNYAAAIWVSAQPMADRLTPSQIAYWLTVVWVAPLAVQVARQCFSKRPAPNPSVKGTSCGKPQAAPYVER